MFLQAEKEYLEHLSAGRFMLLEERPGGRCMFPPRVAAPGTGARSLAWRPASGLGSVHSTTVIHPRAPQVPYNLALIDLAEGVRMMSRVEGIPPEGVFIGMKVSARIAQGNAGPMVVFVPLPGDGQ